MFWREDPRKGVSKSSGPPAYPRNGSVLKGIVHNIDSRPEGSSKWLEVHEYKPVGSSNWVNAEGKWIQFEQGGPVLHEGESAVIKRKGWFSWLF
jgi:hypothetical protein